MEFEEMKKDKGIITIYDDDAQVTIDMSEDNVKKIVDSFDIDINKKQNTTHYFKITHFNVNGVLKLDLQFYDDNFSINGRFSESNIFVENDSSYFHEFEIEDITIFDWNEIVDFVK